MAEAVVSSVIGTVGNLLSQKVAFLKGVEGEVEKLQDELVMMNRFLEDAATKQDGDGRIRQWVSAIRGVSYDAEDAIEVFVAKMEAIKRKPRLLRYAYFPVKIHYLNKIGKQIQSTQSRIVGIEASRQRYGINNLGEGMNDDGQGLQHLKRRTSEYAAQDKNIVGIKMKAESLVSQLLSEDSSRCVFSITGMGGVGKTTLAREIYNHSDVQKEFPCRAWVCVSERFSYGDIMKTIIKQVQPDASCESLERDDLKRMVNQCLRGKRYLIVLDDVWQEEGWGILKDSFPDDGIGNRLLLTSRKKSIAQQAGSLGNLYEMETLGKGESWELFVKTTFADERCPSHLKDLGRKIVQHCGGLPLAIATIGSLLSQKGSSVSIWEGVLGDISSHLAGGAVDGISTILELSYRDLPPHLKFCFKYLALFPEDHEISLRRLVHLWVAEGIVVRSGGAERCVEDTAVDYLEQLIDRNMVQVAKYSFYDQVKSCRLHDLLRDLAIRKGRDENFLEIIGSGRSGDESEASVTSSPRYIAVQEDFFHPQCLSPRLRTILFFCRVKWRCKMFKLLRVLDLENSVIDGLPSEIEEMSLLRYLGLRDTGIEDLPESLGRLSRLQTLDVYTHGCVVEIPNVIWKLGCLRHLYAWRINNPLKLKGLKGLCTLTGVLHHHLKDYNLATLTCLKHLQIWYKEASHDTDILFSSSFSEMVNLGSLILTSFCSSPPLPPDGMRKMSHLSVLILNLKLHALPPLPPNLSRLVLEYSYLQDDPMPMLAKLERLTVLKLFRAYTGKRMEIPSQGFYQLNFLKFSTLLEVKEIVVKKGALPQLRRLRISYCHKLQMIPEELRSKMV